MRLYNNPRIQKGIRRLRALGLKVYVDEIDEFTIAILIDGDSVNRVVSKMINERFRYPYKEIVFDKENNMITVKVYKPWKKPKK